MLRMPCEVLLAVGVFNVEPQHIIPKPHINEHTVLSEIAVKWCHRHHHHHHHRHHHHHHHNNRHYHLHHHHHHHNHHHLHHHLRLDLRDITLIKLFIDILNVLFVLIVPAALMIRDGKLGRQRCTTRQR